MKGLVASLILMLAVGVMPVMAKRQAETIKVQVNTEKRSPKSKLTVRFVELVEDSRCPTDVNCVWAGNAKVKIRVSKNGRSHDMTLDTNGQTQAATAEGYTIKLVELTPSPKSNIRINRNGYVATLELTKLTR
ncbi:MAG TPA: hypothetical protein VJV05_02015 [Pyrinomonadaceae bacterium]|nr:hypothetical protein [Pyrinomonadaceae bacterium]